MVGASNKKYLFIFLSILVLCLYSTVVAIAAPALGTGGYVPGTNLDPDCQPGDTAFDCKVQAGWLLGGNAGTTVGTQFIGTTDAEDFMIKVNSTQVALFGQNGEVALGRNATADETNEIMLGNKMLDLRSQGFVFNDDNFTYDGVASQAIIGSTVNTTNLGSTNNVVFTGTYTGSSLTDIYEVVIEAGGSTFTFNLNGSPISTGVPVDSLVALQDGVSVSFGDFSYIEGESWRMTPTSVNGEEYKFFFSYAKPAIRLGSVSSSSSWEGVLLGTRSLAIGFSNPQTGLLAPIASAAHSIAIGSDVLAEGYGSVAIGIGSIAHGVGDVAIGTDTIASGGNATAFGTNNDAQGAGSFVFGVGNFATGPYSLAFGVSTQATGPESTAFGVETLASNEYATAFGVSTQATGYASLAFGDHTLASEEVTTAFGISTVASGRYSTAFGVESRALSYGEVALGIRPTLYPISTGGNATFAPEDRLFVIGNGTSTRADALTILKNGKVGINIDNFENVGNQINPSSAILQVSGDVAASGDVYAQGVMLTSDERLKTNIAALSYGLSELNQLRPVSYNMIRDNSYQFGFIAQEVRNIFPNLISEGDYLALNYTGMIPVLTKAIQELDLKIQTIDAQATQLVNNEIFLSGLRTWFAKSTNGIEELFSKKVNTETLCVGEVCVNEDQLRTLLQGQQINTGGGSQAPDPTPEPTPEPEIVPDEAPESELEPEPTPEPTPEVPPSDTLPAEGEATPENSPTE